MAHLIIQQQIPSGQTLALYHGDLTEENVDAIVNAANPSLAHGGGVAAAIVRRGGLEIQQESKAWIKQHGPAGHDKPALTSGGRLPARWVIHAVGPMWGSGDEDRKLCDAYTSALQLAYEKQFASIAFPSISTGIFGFPVERAATIAVQAILDFCTAHPGSSLRDIRFTLIDVPTVEVFQAELEKLGKVSSQ